MVLRISKTLTANDTAENGSHQAGLLIPKKPDVRDFFPELDSKKLNPYKMIELKDPEGVIWSFKFIYYNNKLVKSKLTGKLGTRNEYRLTCMTKFIRTYELKAGDILIFEKNKEGKFLINYEKFTKGTLKIKSDELWDVEFA
jgi:hypothetical protein